MPNVADMTGLLDRMRLRLSEAYAVAEAISIVARQGWADHAFAMALGIEDLIHDANHLLQAAGLLSRQSRKTEVNEAEP